MASAVEAAEAPTLRDKLLWLGLSACGSMLLLSVTNHLTENVAPIPLLWILPLAIYLLTFALSFNRPSLYWRWLIVRLLAVSMGAFGSALYDPSFTESVQVSLPVFCTNLFLCCFFCHGELAKRRPASRLSHVVLPDDFTRRSAGGDLRRVDCAAHLRGNL